MHTQHMQLSAHHSTVYQVHAAPLDLSMTSDLHELSGGPVGPSSLPGITYTSSVKKKKSTETKTSGWKSIMCVCVCMAEAEPGAETSCYALDLHTHQVDAEGRN